MIYLASPYTAETAKRREFNFEQVRTYCITRMLSGAVVFSPIVYGHELSKVEGLPTDYLWWQSFNDHMLKAAFSMEVLKLPDWEHSRGVAHEINFARQHNIPVRYIEWNAE